MQDKVKSESMDHAIKLMQLGGLVRQAVKLVRLVSAESPPHIYGLPSRNVLDTDTRPFLGFHNLHNVS